MQSVLISHGRNLFLRLPSQSKQCYNVIFRSTLNSQQQHHHPYSFFSTLPYHLIVPMPALSPTMTTGTLSSWKLSPGDSFSAGDVIAEIQTDKATMDFEAQDDGIVAKLLLPDGSEDVPVGKPILVVVEDVADVSAFENFVVDDNSQDDTSTAAVVVETKKEEVKVSPPVPPVTTPVKTEPTPSTVISTPAVTTVATESTTTTTESVVLSPKWNHDQLNKSPLYNTLKKSQQQYIDLYGSTGIIP